MIGLYLVGSWLKLRSQVLAPAHGWLRNSIAPWTTSGRAACDPPFERRWCGHQTADFRRYVMIKTYQNCSSAIIQNTQEMFSIVFLAAFDQPISESSSLFHHWTMAPSRIARPTFSIWRSSKKVLRNSVAVNCGKIGELFFLAWLTLQWLTVYQHVYYGMHNTIVYILKTWCKSR